MAGRVVAIPLAAPPLFTLLQFGVTIVAFVSGSLVCPQCSHDGLGCPGFEHNLRKTGIYRITKYLITVSNTNKIYSTLITITITT
jgi:hypothetical protein